MTFLAALRHDRIEAPWFLEGPIDGESFRLYVKEISRRVVLATSSSWTISAATEARPCVSSSAPQEPSYSSCPNTLPVFAKLKNFLRREAARTVEAVCFAIGEVLKKLFSPEECLSYLANAGYGRT
jgi:hypothetical protein